jgi:hypothetical protein
MANVSSKISQLKKERDRVERQLSGLNAALTAFANVYGSKPIRKRRKMSAKSRAMIAAAQRRRWAKFKKSAKK